MKLRSLLTLMYAVAFIGGVSGAVQAETINWQDHRVTPKAFWVTGNEVIWAKEVEKATKGRLKIAVYPSGSSGFKGPAALDAVSENLVQIAAVWGSHVAGQERIMELLDLPLFVPADIDFRFKLWEALYPDFAKLLSKKYGVRLLDMLSIDPRALYTKQKVTNLSELKGLKIRAIGPADTDFTKAIGARATTTNWTELYTALQQGVVDGVWTSPGGFFAMKFNEVVDNVFLAANAGPSLFQVVNEKALAKLPADVRKAFLAKQDSIRKRNRASYRKLAAWGAKMSQKKNVKQHAVSKADQAMMVAVARPIVVNWAARLDPESRKIFDKAKSMIDAFHAGK
ncbi:MAG: TRAP transporter substrate-binding protein [Alphaproteobacteria bacterium]